MEIYIIFLHMTNYDYFDRIQMELKLVFETNYIILEHHLFKEKAVGPIPIARSEVLNFGARLAAGHHYQDKLSIPKKILILPHYLLQN
jgi:hypothetical protein